MSGESASERWSPAQRVESVLISVLSLLDDAEVSSPANVDASIMLRKEPAEYKARCLRDTEESKKDIPAGYTMPTSETAFAVKKEDERFMMDTWDDSDEGEFDEDFGGSDSEVEDQGEDDEDEDMEDAESSSDETEAEK